MRLAISVAVWVASVCNSTASPPVSSPSDLEKLEWLASQTQLDHVVFTGMVVNQETRIQDRSGDYWPYTILEIKIAEVLLGKSTEGIRVVVPASYYVKDGKFLRCARFSHGIGPSVKEMDSPLVFFERDRVLISAGYLARSVYDVDSTGAAWAGNFVCFLKGKSDSLYQAVAAFDEGKGQTIAENGYEVNPVDFVTRDFKPTGTTLTEVRVALRKQFAAPKK